MNTEEIAGLIDRRRRQVLVHSIIYYKLDKNLIPDDTWAKWAVELETLQTNFPEIAANVPYAVAFSAFDHSTGYSLPLEDGWGVNKARQLVQWAESHGWELP